MNKLAQKMPWSYVEIPIGGLFQFRSDKTRHAGDVIDFAMDFDPWDSSSEPTMVKAKITKVIEKGFYEAERTE